MPIPGYQTLMLPALKAVADGAEHSPSDVFARLATEFHLSSDELAELLPSGRTPLFNSRAHWAVTYLAQAGLVEKPRKAVWLISDEGQRVLARSPDQIDNKFLGQYPSFVQFRARRSVAVDPANGRDKSGTASMPLFDPSSSTPEELIEATWQDLRAQVAQELLDKIKAGSTTFFERLVVELLVRMGYGGTFAEAARVTRASADGGIDGVIKEDRLGLDTIYVQAKRWEQTVGRPEIQKFAGALEGERARKGVFITTSDFSSEARGYIQRIDKRIVLIDGSALADLMIEHGVAVTKDREYVIPKIDLDFFEET